MLGLGTDICSIERIEKLLNKDQERLLSRVLTVQERTQKQWDAPSLARRWAAKEAISKAFGQGIGATISFQDIEITYTPKGAPQVQILGVFATAKVQVSISDDAGIAMACAVVESLQ